MRTSGYSSDSALGSGGFVGAGVASPDVTAPTLIKLSEDSEMGMSIARSGSDGAENRSEKPAVVLTTFSGGVSFPVLLSCLAACFDNGGESKRNKKG